MTLSRQQREELAATITEVFSPDELAKVVVNDLGLRDPGTIFPGTFARFALELIERCERRNFTQRLFYALCSAKPELTLDDFLQPVVNCA
jgi:hypothetical protein